VVNQLVVKEANQVKLREQANNRVKAVNQVVK
jgi:hypothetical protein